MRPSTRTLVAMLLAGLFSWTAVAVRRHDDTPDGHMLASDTVEKIKEALAEGAPFYKTLTGLFKRDDSRLALYGMLKGLRS